MYKYVFRYTAVNNFSNCPLTALLTIYRPICCNCLLQLPNADCSTVYTARGAGRTCAQLA